MIIACFNKCNFILASKSLSYVMKISPALLLFFLSPAIAELLSGSAPPIEFFNPFGFILLSSLYGSGALIARELKIRWNKGYVSLFILGAAYGIIEEALMVKSFFDPNWMDLGVLGVYGRWQGVNWVWVEWLTIYHAIFSIAIPITLVELAFPKERNLSWIGNKQFKGLGALLIGVTAFGFLFLTDFYPSILQYLLFLVIVGVLVGVAMKTPIKAGKGGLNRPTPRRSLLFGFVAVLVLFLYFGGGPNLIEEPLILMIGGVVIVAIIFLFLGRYRWNRKTLYQKFCLSAGALLFLVFLTPFQEFDANRLDNTRGMVIVGIIALIMLLLLRKRLKQKENTKGIQHWFSRTSSFASRLDSNNYVSKIF